MSKSEMGRPESIKIDETKLKALMRLKPTLLDTAAFFDCSDRAILRYIRKHYDSTFVEFREKHMVHTRLELIRTAIDAATKYKNTAMMIFCLKNLCGWRDKQPGEDLQVNVNQFANLSDEELAKKIKDLEGK